MLIVPVVVVVVVVVHTAVLTKKYGKTPPATVKSSGEMNKRYT
jgi:hypothetical protein